MKKIKTVSILTTEQPFSDDLNKITRSCTDAHFLKPEATVLISSLHQSCLLFFYLLVQSHCSCDGTLRLMQFRLSQVRERYGPFCRFKSSFHLFLSLPPSFPPDSPSLLLSARPSCSCTLFLQNPQSFTVLPLILWTYRKEVWQFKRVIANICHTSVQKNNCNE